MLKRVFLLLLLSLVISCKAQTIMPLERKIDFVEAGKGIPENTYFKDVNGILNKYIGTWKGPFDNKELTINVMKNLGGSFSVKTDILNIRYLITVGTKKIIIENTMNLPDSDDLVITGIDFNSQNKYISLYTGRNSLCGQTGEIIMQVVPNTNDSQMTFRLRTTQDISVSEECPTGMVSQVMPTSYIILTKQ